MLAAFQFTGVKLIAAPMPLLIDCSNFCFAATAIVLCTSDLLSLPQVDCFIYLRPHTNKSCQAQPKYYNYNLTVFTAVVMVVH